MITLVYLNQQCHTNYLFASSIDIDYRKKKKTFRHSSETILRPREGSCKSEWEKISE